MIKIFLGFLGLRQKTALSVLKNVLTFLDFHVHTNPDLAAKAGVPDSLTVFSFKAG